MLERDDVEIGRRGAGRGLRGIPDVDGQRPVAVIGVEWLHAGSICPLDRNPTDIVRTGDCWQGTCVDGAGDEHAKEHTV